jgi:hypothetical protein
VGAATQREQYNLTRSILRDRAQLQQMAPPSRRRRHFELVAPDRQLQPVPGDRPDAAQAQQRPGHPPSTCEMPRECVRPAMTASLRPCGRRLSYRWAAASGRWASTQTSSPRPKRTSTSAQRTLRPYVGARVLRTGASLTQSRGLPSKALFGSAYMCWEAPVFIERTSVGLDVHARSVVAAVDPA